MLSEAGERHSAGKVENTRKMNSKLKDRSTHISAFFFLIHFNNYVPEHLDSALSLCPAPWYQQAVGLCSPCNASLCNDLHVTAPPKAVIPPLLARAMSLAFSLTYDNSLEPGNPPSLQQSRFFVLRPLLPRRPPLLIFINCNRPS